MPIMTLNENARRYGIALLAIMLAIAAVVAVGTVLAGSAYDKDPSFDFGSASNSGYESSKVGLVFNPNEEINRLEATPFDEVSDATLAEIVNKSSGNVVASINESNISGTIVFDNLSLKTGQGYKLLLSNDSNGFTKASTGINFPFTGSHADINAGLQEPSKTRNSYTYGWRYVTFYNQTEVDSYQTPTPTATETATATATDIATDTATSTDSGDSTTTTTAETAISGGGAILPDDSAPTPLQAAGVLAVAVIAGLAIWRADR